MVALAVFAAGRAMVPEHVSATRNLPPLNGTNGFTARPKFRLPVNALDGSLFAEYRVSEGGQPVIWPIIGPTGAEY